MTVPVCSQSLMASCFPGLAIDYPESKLYWISSGNGTINRCNLDGSNLEVIESVRGQLSKATALAIMGESWQGDGDGSWSPFLSPDPPQTLATSSSCGGDASPPKTGFRPASSRPSCVNLYSCDGRGWEKLLHVLPSPCR